MCLLHHFGIELKVPQVIWTANDIFLIFNSFKQLNLFLNLSKTFSITIWCKECLILNCIYRLFLGLLKGLIRKLNNEYAKSSSI